MITIQFRMVQFKPEYRKGTVANILRPQSWSVAVLVVLPTLAFKLLPELETDKSAPLGWIHLYHGEASTHACDRIESVASVSRVWPPSVSNLSSTHAASEGSWQGCLRSSMLGNRRRSH